MTAGDVALEGLLRPTPALAGSRVWPGHARRREWLAPAGLGAVTIVAKVALSWPRVGDSFALVLITWATVVSFVLVGLALLASDLPRANGWGCLLVAAATVPGDLNEPAYAAAGLSGVGYVLEFGYLPAAVALVLRYPLPRLTVPGRWLVTLIAAATMLPRIPLLVVTGPLPDGLYRTPGWPTVWAPTLHDVVLVRGAHLVAAGLLLVGAAALVRRAVSSAGLSRRAVIPLASIGAVCAVAASVDQAIWAVGVEALRGIPAAAVRDLTAACIPFALMAQVARRRAAAGEVADRVLAAARPGTTADLERALRAVLLDPSLTLRRPESSGEPVEVAPTDHGFADVDGDDGSLLARITYDPRVVERDGLFDVALASVRAVLENQRLADEVRRQLEELQESRSRITAAGWAERRQVERDLHDGAQQQFLAVAATLAQADLAEDDQLRPMVLEARRRLREALAELRRLARGIHPAALSQGGLRAALPALCAASPTRCDLDIDLDVNTGLGAGRFDATVESTAYFVVAEAVANAVKHAPGSAIRISVRTCGDALLADVTDAGPGGAHAEPGGGVAGLRDRVEAVGGSLAVHSDPCRDHPTARGSTVSARLPLRPE